MNDFNYSLISVSFGTISQGTATVIQRDEEQQDMAGEKSQIQKSVRVREFWQIPLLGIQEINYVEPEYVWKYQEGTVEPGKQGIQFRKVREGQTATTLSRHTSILDYLCI